MKNILVAVDLKEGTEELLSFARNLAQQNSSKVWVVHVSEPEPEFVGYSVGPQYIIDLVETELKEEHRNIKKITDDLNYIGINAEGILLKGGTIEMLQAEVEKQHIDFAIIGHRKHGFFHKAFFGHTDVSFIENVKIPVLIVPVVKSDKEEGNKEKGMREGVNW